ncbi:MAG: hypothetical protein J3R72DRAFT_484693 [Linnemannia gamsii]|nr:MAG: hypothetical protein J3R72DRAFT_484693 [Linnemannia gamsii]
MLGPTKYPARACPDSEVSIMVVGSFTIPDDKISRNVYSEDKLFETWNYYRTEEVVLANCLYDVVPYSYESVTETLCEFKSYRYYLIRAQYAQTYIAAKLQCDMSAALTPETPKRGTAAVRPQG